MLDGVKKEIKKTHKEQSQGIFPKNKKIVIEELFSTVHDNIDRGFPQGYGWSFGRGRQPLVNIQPIQLHMGPTKWHGG